MNKTTVKRGIGAAILALVAAGLLLFLLKDKADKRQDIVDMPIPGSDNTTLAMIDNSDKLPQLSMKLPQLSMDNNIDSTASENLTTGTVGDHTTHSASSVTEESPLDFTIRPPSTQSDEFRDLSDVNFINNENDTETTSSSNDSNQNINTVAAQSTNNSSPAKNTAIASTTSQSVNTIKAAPSRASSNTTAVSRQTQVARTEATSRRAPTNTSRSEATTSRRTPTTASRTEPSVTRRATQRVEPNTSTRSAPRSTTTQKQPTLSIAPETSNTGYAIQLLATSSSSRAQSLVDVMKGEGYEAYSTKLTQNGKLLYRVRIGQYVDKSSATDAHDAMKRRYKKNDDVNRSAVVRR